mmetsp:Transcript_5156/g.10437  ORF Transcript_5156/g.10437 Transcript_5156/m.10437 type:complete len:289 (+) Transcript_5156:629-1495(+)
MQGDLVETFLARVNDLVELLGKRRAFLIILGEGSPRGLELRNHRGHVGNRGVVNLDMLRVVGAAVGGAAVDELFMVRCQRAAIHDGLQEMLGERNVIGFGQAGGHLHAKTADAVDVGRGEDGASIRRQALQHLHQQRLHVAIILGNARGREDVLRRQQRIPETIRCGRDEIFQRGHDAPGGGRLFMFLQQARDALLLRSNVCTLGEDQCRLADQSAGGGQTFRIDGSKIGDQLFAEGRNSIHHFLSQACPENAIQTASDSRNLAQNLDEAVDVLLRVNVLELRHSRSH